jgi:hypothetical protein
MGETSWQDFRDGFTFTYSLILCFAEMAVQAYNRDVFAVTLRWFSLLHSYYGGIDIHRLHIIVEDSRDSVASTYFYFFFLFLFADHSMVDLTGVDIALS